MEMEEEYFPKRRNGTRIGNILNSVAIKGKVSSGQSLPN
jgi:hypothetical protein